MRIDNVKLPKSSFLSVDKDLSLIVNKLLANERLKRLLYYTTANALERPNITEDQGLDMFGKQIRIIPKLYVDSDVFCYMIISFDDFVPNSTNPEFRDNLISFDIICHFDQWRLNDCELRPYKVAAEIDSMLNNQKLTGIGTLEFLGAHQLTLNSEYGGISLLYSAIHGEEDREKLNNPAQEERFEEDFYQYIENIQENE